MNQKIVFWIGLLMALSVLLVACSGSTAASQVENPPSADSEVAANPESTENMPTEEPDPTDDSVVETPSSFPSPLTGQIAPDFTITDEKGNTVNLIEQLQDNEHVVLVFYFSSSCTPCMAQLVEIEKDRARYEDKGAQVMAIAVQSEKRAALVARRTEAQFPILADSGNIVAEAYGVLDGGVSTPSVFIINKDQQVVWSEISHIEGSGCGTERVPSQTILENLG
jgi:peroxiredoxin